MPADNAKKPDRACLGCRKSKTKCVGGTPGAEGNEGRCIKCKRLDLDCVFVELRKVGRPRKEQRETIEEGDNWMDEWLDTEEGTRFEQLFQALSPILSPISTIGTVLSSPSAEEGKFNFEMLHSQPLPPMMLLPSFPSLTPRELTLGTSVRDLPLLARQYHLFVHPFLPLLSPKEDQLVTYLSSAPIELLMSIISLIDPTLAIDFTIPVHDYGTTIYHLQASVFATHAAFGAGDPIRARSIVKWTQTMILRLRWNELDNFPRPAGSSHEEDNLIRRLWYEVYNVDIMLSVLTGSRPFLELVHAQVNLPETNQNSAMSLRVRALALLSTCTAVPTGSLPLDSHLSALTSLGTNISLMAEDIYIRSSSLYGVEEAAIREHAFMASLISSAAIIFLYNSSYSASAFTCGFDPTQRPARTTFETIRRAGQHIFGTLRSSLASTALETVHSPFFGCSLLIGAQGRITTFLEEDDEEESVENDLMKKWNRSAIASDLELAEWVLEKQREKWHGVEVVLNRVKELRLSVIEWSDASHMAFIGS